MVSECRRGVECGNGVVGPWWRLAVEMEMQGAVDGGNTFADARFVEWRLEAVDGDLVFAGPRVIDVVREAIGEGDIVAGIVMRSSLAFLSSSPSPTTAISSVICSSIPATLSLFFKFPVSFVPLM